jgi:hypothetical protein
LQPFGQSREPLFDLRGARGERGGSRRRRRGLVTLSRAEPGPRGRKSFHHSRGFHIDEIEVGANSERFEDEPEGRCLSAEALAFDGYRHDSIEIRHLDRRDPGGNELLQTGSDDAFARRPREGEKTGPRGVTKKADRECRRSGRSEGEAEEAGATVHERRPDAAADDLGPELVDESPKEETIQV